LVAPAPLQFHNFLTPGYAQNETIPVSGSVTGFDIGMNLSMGSAGAAPTSPIPFAELSVTLINPSGAQVGQRTLTPQSPRAAISITKPPAGTYRMVLQGDGVSDGSEGASYSIVVVYLV
jgi:hypothetical protein